MASRQPQIKDEHPEPESAQPTAIPIDSRFPRRAFLGSTATLALAALISEPASAGQPPRVPPALPGSQPASLPLIPRLTVQLGHADAVTSACFSPDGRFILTGSEDNTALLWESATGKMLRVFQGHSSPVSAVCFSADGRFILTGSEDNTARLWEVATGKTVRTFVGNPLPVTSVCFSPDGRFVLAGSGNTALLWDAATGKLVRTFQGHSAEVYSVCFSPDGKHILTGSDDKTARLWDSATGKAIRTFQGHSNTVTSVCFSRDSQFILTGSRDTTARQWDYATGKQLRTFQGHRGWVTAVGFSRDSRFILTGSNDNTARLWEIATGKMVRTFEDKSATISYAVTSVSFSADGRLILIGSRDNMARLWDSSTGKVFQTFEGNSAASYSVCFSADGRFILAGGLDGTSLLWEVSTGKVLRAFKAHTNIVTSVCFSPDGRFALTGSWDNTARLWDVSTGKTIRTFQGHSNWVYSVCFSQDGRFVLTGSNDNTARLWEVSTGKAIRTFEGHSLPVTSVCFSQDGRFVLTGSGDTTMRLWDTTTGKAVRTFEGNSDVVNSVCFSPDGRFILTGSDDNTARLWDSATGKALRAFEGHSAGIQSVCFSPDGRFILTGSSDGTARLWDIATGKVLRTLQSRSTLVVSVCFSPNGRFVLTVNGDSTLRLWDATTGREVCALISFQNGTWAVVAPDGRFDCPDLDEVRGLHWMIPDEPLRPLPLEIFQRQYYEPGLLPRLWNGEKFPPLPSLADLNRIQPKVTVAGAEITPDSTTTVSIDVSSVVEKGKMSGVFDLRLFRDGQLVGVRAGELKDGRATFTGIRLPQRVDLKSVEFSAYCFNKSLVKSETVKHALPLPARSGMAASRRAFVVCMGVDSSQGDGLLLRYAVRDAEATVDAVSTRLRATGQYTEVVTIRLLAPATANNPDAVTATKADLRAVLAKLAGKTPTEEDTARLTNIPGAETLKPATPDDLLLLSFSGHGYAGEGGVFYLLPYDVGQGQGMTPERLARCISSDDLSAWLLGVDAGDIAFIVDACHSAQAVEGDGTFKPGPMGSRGLGQLAYDKRILLLAATQASNVALESGNLGHGLLTYALIKEGLEGEKAVAASPENHLTLSSWLDYGVKRVPELWEDIRTGKSRLARGVAPEIESAVAAGKRKDLQQPMLFDFSKKVGTERDPRL